MLGIGLTFSTKTSLSFSTKTSLLCRIECL